MADWSEDLRSNFPLCERRAYLFAGAQAPLARSVREAMERFLDLWAEQVWRFELTEWRHFDEAAEVLGDILGCDASRIIATEGTSHSMNLATSMVLARWRRDGERRANVVLHRESHPASSFAWVNAKRLGAPIDLRWPVPEPGEPELDALTRQVDQETIAVVLTHVSHLSGTRLDAAAFAARFPERSFAILLDAAQSAGALPLTAETEVLDFIGLPSYKWLFGPPGIGFLVAGASWIQEVGPPFVGWASASDVWAMDPQNLSLASGGASFRLGIPNFIGMAGARAALELSRDAGRDQIADRIQSLTQMLLNEITAAGYSTPTPLEWAKRAGVVCLDVPDVHRAVDLLLSEGIEVGFEGSYMRVDPHAYNTETEIAMLIERLPSIAPPGR